MDETSSSGNQRGSLKDRLYVLNILLRISRKKKLRLEFSNINATKIINSNKMYLYFYNPVKVVLDDKLKINNTILYNKAKENKVKLTSTKKINNIDFEFSKSIKKKGIGFKEIKEEISKKYDIKKEKITDKLIEDYQVIKNDDLFEEKIGSELKEDFIKDRIFVNDEINLIYSYTDAILAKDINYDLKVYLKDEEKLKKIIERYTKDLEKMELDISKFEIVTENELKIINLNVLLKNLFGLGIGILTLPFSSPISLALGTSLIAKSLDNIEKNVKISNNETKKIKYKVELKDIITAGNALSSTDYLLEETLEKLDSLKYKIKHNESKIPDFEKNLKKIELLEESLIKKKRKLNKIILKLENNKIKVLKREDVIK